VSRPGPTRTQSDLADMVEMLLDKGVVVNADIVVSVGETELLGVQVRAAIASFETAAEYGLEFPEGTDMHSVETAASGRSTVAPDDDTEAEAEDTERPPAGNDDTRDDDPDDTRDDDPDHPRRRPRPDDPQTSEES